MLKDYLNQSHPLFKDKWKLIISVSAFIGLFMLIFQPFGLAAFHGNYKDLFLAAYGLITFVILTFDFFVVQRIFKKWFDQKSWNVGKQILWAIFIIFTIGIGNFLYSAGGFSLWNWRLFLSFQIYTLLVAVIPIVVLIIIKQNLLLSNNLKQAEDFNRELKLRQGKHGKNIVSLVADNGKDKLEIESENLLYIESIGNYVKIFHFDNNKLIVSILRCALKRAEFQLKNVSTLVRCHRAFMVNIDKVIRAKGNSLGLKLDLEGAEVEVPVSRNFVNSLKNRMKSPA